VKFVSIFTFDPAKASSQPDEAAMHAMGSLIKEMMDAGVMLDTGGVAPTGVSMRVRRSDGNVSVTDGPFTESKELIGGFALFEVASKEEVLEYTRRFLDLVGNGTCQLIEVGPTPQS
jgi:hypothetical protein